MPRPKEFYYAGDPVNKFYNTLFILIGISGFCIDIYGLMQPIPQFYYVCGSLLLLSTAFYYKLTYFIALELILISGYGAHFLLGIGPIIQVVVPILLCVQLVVYYLMSGQLNNIFQIIGLSGISLLSIGFAYENQWIFFFGSLEVAIFSFYQAYQQCCIALIWAVLNIVFVIVAAYQLYFSLLGEFYG